MPVKLKYSGKYPNAHFNQDIVVKNVSAHKEHVKLVLQEHGKDTKRELKKVITTSVGNGRHYSGLPNRSSSPYKPPVSQSGRLANGFSYKVTPLQLTVGNKATNKGAPYAAFLEEGTKKMKKRPYFVNTIEAGHTQLRIELQDIVSFKRILQRWWKKKAKR